MAVQRGKKRRRPRSHRTSGIETATTPVIVDPPSPKPKPRRRAKPLAERSPIFPAIMGVLCLVAGVVFTFTPRQRSGQNLAFLGIYVICAALYLFWAYRIYRARGGWR